jgi:L-aminopeptidase/D-esterase-like protein
VNTVIGVVATSARLDKEQAKSGQMAQDGVARRASGPPCSTVTRFSPWQLVSAGRTNIVGAFAAETFAQAILKAVRAAHTLAGLPSANELGT